MSARNPFTRFSLPGFMWPYFYLDVYLWSRSPDQEKEGLLEVYWVNGAVHYSFEIHLPSSECHSFQVTY